MLEASEIEAELGIKEKLIQKIQGKQAVVGVIGLGYVGLPFAVEKAKAGFKIIGLDRNSIKVEKVNAGQNYIKDVDDQELRDLANSGILEATTDFERLHETDVVVICVPTPLTRNLTPDLTHVVSATTEVAKRLHIGQLVSLESTTYPGTTDDVMKPILEKMSNLKEGVDFFLANSPERVDPGNHQHTTRNTNKVVGASDKNSLEVAIHFYQQAILHVVPVSSAKAAELTKVFENTFRAVNIALVNELAMLCDRMDIDVWEVLDAAFTKPFGIMPFYPGPGVGGHCIPLDPHYLEWKAREYNFNTRFIALAGEINRRMPEFVIQKAMRLLSNSGRGLKNAKIMILGIAYKKDIDDPRESPVAEVIKKLLDLGAEVSYHDPFVPTAYELGFDLTSVPLTETSVAAADIVVITTAHTSVDYPMICKHARIVFDTRNATKGLPKGNNLYKL